MFVPVPKSKIRAQVGIGRQIHPGGNREVGQPVHHAGRKADVVVHAVERDGVADCTACPCSAVLERAVATTARCVDGGRPGAFVELKQGPRRGEVADSEADLDAVDALFTGGVYGTDDVVISRIRRRRGVDVAGDSHTGGDRRVRPAGSGCAFDDCSYWRRGRRSNSTGPCPRCRRTRSIRSGRSGRWVR